MSVVYAVSDLEKSMDIEGFPILTREDAKARGVSLGDLEVEMNIKLGISFLDELRDLFSGNLKGSGVLSARKRAFKMIRREALARGYSEAVVTHQGAFFEDPLYDTPMVHDNDPNVYVCNARFYSKKDKGEVK